MSANIKVNLLIVDEAYQRTESVSLRHVQQIAANFEWERFGAIIVASRPNGVYAIIDGQHRHLAAKRLGLKEVPCLVYDVGSVEKEARLFKELNSARKGVTHYNKHKADLVAGDKDAIEMAVYLHSIGLPITNNIRQRGIRAVAKVSEMWRKDKQLTKDVLQQLAIIHPQNKSVGVHVLILGAFWRLAQRTEGASLERKWTMRARDLGEQPFFDAIKGTAQNGYASAYAALAIAGVLNYKLHDRNKLDVTPLLAAIGKGE